MGLGATSSARPSQGREADAAGCNLEEGQVDLGPPFVADHEAPEGLEPCEGPLDYPTMLAKLLCGFHPAPRNAGEHAPDSAGHPAAAEVIGLVGVQFPETPPGAPTTMAKPWRGIDQLLEWNRVMLVRRPHQHRHRDSIGIGDQVVPGPVLPSIRGVRADRLAPLFALMLEASRAPRSQSIRPASFNSSSRIRRRSSHTPRSCHAWRRRQHVMPLPQPISFGFGAGGGSSGAMRFQSSEGKISRAIQVHCARIP
ncbi:hypothetical protein METESE_20920 [Mesoterricola sediminis]|uniref:Uncharacterized protein n=1 Tax=Mesoterricola sediminis TaxID=2927980 RepID=A0AA48KCG7_9BACT|nr:hypothetical protein METESE_20920 [Mesoterricola sediminis]